jgi:hypothetical protein
MQVLKDFFHSEKGVFAFLVPAVAVTYFAVTGKIDYSQWANTMLGLSAIYTGGKAIQGAGAKVAEGKHNKALAEAAREEIAELHAILNATDEEVDEALAAKFGKSDDEEE